MDGDGDGNGFGSVDASVHRFRPHQVFCWEHWYELGAVACAIAMAVRFLGIADPFVTKDRMESAKSSLI